MSRVHLIAADKELPCLSVDLPCIMYREVNVHGSVLRGHATYTPCFAVQPNSYYKWTVDELGFTLKPHQYEIDWYPTPESMEHLRAYLSENFSPGETVELWSLWVGDGPGELVRSRCAFRDLTLDTMSASDFYGNSLGQRCITVDM